MKSRVSLVLMEQLIMVLIFALAAAICLQVFVGADQISRKTDLQDRAVLLAQNGAETLKAAKGDLSVAARQLGGTVDGTGLTADQEDLCLTIMLMPGEIPGLGQAQVQVLEAQTGELLFSLTAGWQKEVG